MSRTGQKKRKIKEIRQKKFQSLKKSHDLLRSFTAVTSSAAHV